ncbi:MAG: hypothetical protein IPN19_02170 [Elusimicrobia bacterium]|nr:hypothetical protein [Elusimicrobiota bacterium]
MSKTGRRGELVWQETAVTGTNEYRVIQGQAQVILSVTRNVSTTAGGTQSSDTTTTVNYTYNENGQLTGAAGSVRGTSRNQVFNDVVRNGATVRELVWQETAVTGTNEYRVIQGQAQVILSVTRNVSTTAGGTQSSDTTTTVNYTYDGNGVLSGATGDVRGTSRNQVFNDVVRNGATVRELVWQETAVTGTNEYRVIQGQAQVILSVTRNVSTTAGGTQSSDTTTTVNYTYNENGQLTSATGWTVGTSNQRVATSTRVVDGYEEDGETVKYKWVVTGDTDQDGVEEAGEVWGTENQTMRSETDNRYAVILGQAQVVRSETKSDAVDEDGNVIGATDHGHNHSETVVNYVFNEKGQLTSATGRTVGTSNQRVATSTRVVDGYEEDGETVKYKWVVTGDTDQDGVEEAGEVWGTENQTMRSETDNRYAVILGQAQVVRSETKSDAVDEDGNVIGATDHGHNHSETVVNYVFNEKGQLTSATGRTVGTSNQRVATSTRVVDGYEEDGETVKYKWVVVGDTDQDGVEEAGEVWGTENQTMRSETDNRYAVILGQAQVVRSETKSDAVDEDGNVIGATDHGHNHSETVVNYVFNEKGQLTSATGRTEGTSNQRVATSTRVVDGYEEDGETVKYKWVVTGDTDQDGVEEAGEVWGRRTRR